MIEISSKPPSSNRGVQSSTRSVLRACVDWVQVTLQIVQPDTVKDGNSLVVTKTGLQKIYDLLGLDESLFSMDAGGLYGYRSRKVFGHIYVMYDHPAVPGYHVQLSGQGCREFEMLSSKNWSEFMKDCVDQGGKFVRLDTAIDDIARTGQKTYFTVDKLFRKVKEAAVTSLFKKGKKVEGFLIEDGSSLGETLYFGRESSDIQIRFYEKDYERESAGEEVESDVVAWNRTELQLRRDRAHLMALHLINSPDDYLKVVTGVLRNYLNFRIKSITESNKSKWDICSWWLEFLQDSERLTLTLIAPDATIERTQSWINKQVNPALAMLFYANNSDMDLVHEMLLDGLERLNERQVKLAHDHQAKLLSDSFEWDRLKDAKYQDWMARTYREPKKITLPDEEEESRQDNIQYI